MPSGVYERTPEMRRAIADGVRKRFETVYSASCTICKRSDKRIFKGRCGRCYRYFKDFGVEWSSEVKAGARSQEVIKLKNELDAAQSEIKRLAGELAAQKALVAEKSELVNELRQELRYWQVYGESPNTI